MTVHTGKVEAYEGSNVTMGGKDYFIPPELSFIKEKFPPGTAVRMTDNPKGTVKSMFLLNEEDIREQEAQKQPAKTEVEKKAESYGFGTGATISGNDRQAVAADLDRMKQQAGGGVKPPNGTPVKPQQTPLPARKTATEPATPPPDAPQKPATALSAKVPPKTEGTPTPPPQVPQKATNAVPVGEPASESPGVVFDTTPPPPREKTVREILMLTHPDDRREALIVWQNQMARATDICLHCIPAFTMTIQELEDEVMECTKRLMLESWRQTGFSIMDDSLTKSRY